MSADFQEAIESGDLAAIESALATNVVFRSPAVHRPYEGRTVVMPILRAVIQVFEDFRYTDRLDAPDRTVLFFSARVGDRNLEGMDAITLDADGRVAELVVMIRPLSALTAVVEAMGPMLAAG